MQVAAAAGMALLASRLRVDLAAQTPLQVLQLSVPASLALRTPSQVLELAVPCLLARPCLMAEELPGQKPREVRCPLA